MNYHQRRFRPVADPGGEGGRVAVYQQEGDLLWGEFSGGDARRGALTGRCAPDGSIDFTYCLVLKSGSVIAGACHSTPSILPDGRIRLHEEWERFGPYAAKGVSQLEEIPLEEQS